MWNAMGLEKFELDTAGVREILLSAGAMELVAAEANARCPAGCTVDTYTGTNRVNARITTATAEAYKDNLENNTLLKAIGG